MANTWLSLLPPLLVLISGFWTRNVILSLVLGVLSAAFIATDFSISGMLTLSLHDLWVNLEITKLSSMSAFLTSWNLLICLFLFMLAIIVTLIGYSGAAYAYATYAQRKIQSKQGAESSSLVLSLCLFIDDYFSSLTVGSVMQPLTDQFYIPRVKLAFLVDAMSAPLAILCPLSSWVAAVIGFLQENGVTTQITSETRVLADPLNTYAHILPFIFYSFIMIFSALFIVRKRIQFGSMKIHETIAQTTGNLFGGKAALNQTIRIAPEHNKKNATMLDFIVPIVTLLGSIIGGMLYSGGWHIFGGHLSIIQALRNSNAAITLFVGGSIALTFCTLFFILRHKIRVRHIPELYWDGIKLMAPAVGILLLAWTLGDILRDNLKTGQYLASLLSDALPVTCMPAIFFLCSLSTSFAIGSSWGTIAIMMPIAIPMVISMSNAPIPILVAQVPLLLPVLGAIFSGAVAGDHISPISDTTLMSSMSTGCHHIDHVTTQIGYAIPIVIATTIAYLCMGLLMPMGLYAAAFISGMVGIICSIILLYSIDRFQRKNLRPRNGNTI